jgi:Domain of unknown function (DUF4440)
MIRSLGICVLAIALSTSPAAVAQTAGAERAFQAQMNAWNQGDLEAALATYWVSSEMTWVSRRGIERGAADFINSMRDEFAHRPREMGNYSGEILESRSLGSGRALLVVRWAIRKDERQMMGGVSTQVWERKDRKWLIVFEHAS